MSYQGFSSGKLLDHVFMHYLLKFSANNFQKRCNKAKRTSVLIRMEPISLGWFLIQPKLLLLCLRNTGQQGQGSFKDVNSLSLFLKAGLINVTYTHTSLSQAMKTRQHLQKKHGSPGMKKILDILWRNITNQSELCSQTLIKETPTPVSTNPTKPQTPHRCEPIQNRLQV